MITTLALVAIAIAQLIQVVINVLAVRDARRHRAESQRQGEQLLAEQVKLREIAGAPVDVNVAEGVRGLPFRYRDFGGNRQ